MNTHTIRQFILQPDSSGDNITALCFCAFSVVSALSMGLIGVIRITGGHYASAWTYLVLSVLSCVLLVYSLRCISACKPGKISEVAAYPLTVTGFIFGLTVLFFVDGGMSGGVPILFILAVVATPCFMPTADSVVMVCLEIAAYVSNALFASYYPESVGASLTGVGNTFIPILIVAAVLGILCLLYTYAYRSQQSRLDSAIAEANSANEAKSSFLNNMT